MNNLPSAAKMLLLTALVETGLTSPPTAAFTSCTGRGVTEWNSRPDTIKSSLQSWLLSTVTLLPTSHDG